MTLTDGADEMPLGTVVAGRYRLDRSLGSWGMGTVYAASSVTGGRAGSRSRSSGVSTPKIPPCWRGFREKVG